MTFRPTLKELEKVHLVVHPGFGLTHFVDAQMKAERALLEAILEKTTSLRPDTEAAVLILSPSSTSPEITDLVHQIEHALPKNTAKVFAGGMDVTRGNLQPCFDDAREQLYALGFGIDEKTNLLAYGETVDHCVPNAMTAFARQFNLKNRPQLDVLHTDAWIRFPLHDWMEGGERIVPVQEARTAIEYIPIPRNLGSGSEIQA